MAVICKLEFKKELAATCRKITLMRIEGNIGKGRRWETAITFKKKRNSVSNNWNTV